MGYADRDYHRQARGGMTTSRFEGAQVVKWLLIVNVVIFVMQLFLRPEGARGEPVPSVLEEAGYFSIATALHGFQIWRFITFQFLHADFGHVFMNMLVLFFFGPIVERWWGSRSFLVFYLLSGASGALFYTMLYYTPGLLPTAEATTPMLGASAGIFGVLIATAVIAPEGRVYLFFLIPMTMRTFAIGVLIFGVFVVLTDGGNAGGEAGHLGGALAGYLMMKIPALREALLRLNPGVGILRRPRRAPKRRPVYERKLRPKSAISRDDATEIDRILDKINEEGLHTLTSEEREILNRAAEKQR